MSKTKNVIIGGLLIAIVAMSVGYAALAQQLTINGTANINASWNIAFTKIVEGTLTGATTKDTPTISGTSATFEVDLAYPGATATYDITVENKGSIDATLQSISGLDATNSSEPTQIQYEITGITAGEDLNSTETTTFHVTVKWVASDDNTDVIPTTTSKTATITLNYVQKTS